MLLSLTYHHVNSDQFSNKLEVIEEHFNYISTRYKTIFPSEYQASIINIQLCLVFDDAYYDFYHYVFKLLVKYNIKAVLAVPTSYIIEDTNYDSKTRLEVMHSEIMKAENYKNLVPFCTWNELTEKVESKLVKIASHGHKHIRLATASDSEIEKELGLSKNIIESKINDCCDIFVYPYYSYNMKVFEKSRSFYKYCFVSGGIIDYKIKNGLIFRVSADDMKTGKEVFSRDRLIGYFRGALKKRLKKLYH